MLLGSMTIPGSLLRVYGAGDLVLVLVGQQDSRVFTGSRWMWPHGVPSSVGQHNICPASVPICLGRKTWALGSCGHSHPSCLLLLSLVVRFGCDTCGLQRGTCCGLPGPSCAHNSFHNSRGLLQQLLWLHPEGDLHRLTVCLQWLAKVQCRLFCSIVHYMLLFAQLHLQLA
jgi:hypothetical protein